MQIGLLFSHESCCVVFLSVINISFSNEFYSSYHHRFLEVSFNLKRLSYCCNIKQCQHFRKIEIDLISDIIVSSSSWLLSMHQNSDMFMPHTPLFLTTTWSNSSWPDKYVTMDKSDSALILKCDKNQNTTTCDNPDDKTEQHIMIPSKPSKLITALSSLLPSNFLNLPPRWQNWFVRGQSGLLLISAFCSLISLGPLGLFGLTIVVQVNIEK